jgi:predicted nucleic acid-binding protein
VSHQEEPGALGERAAIALAATIHADLLLIDEAAERAEARRRNLRVTGTLECSVSLRSSDCSTYRV